MKTGFDLDGVVVRDFWGLTRNLKIGIFFNYYFLFTRLGRFCYQFRQPDKKVRTWIENRRRRGEKVVIISGTNQEHLLVVQKWLDLRKVLCDELWLKEWGEEIAEFKAKALLRTNCCFYLENDPQVAKKIATILGNRVRIRKWKGLYLLKLKQGQKE